MTSNFWKFSILLFFCFSNVQNLLFGDSPTESTTGSLINLKASPVTVSVFRQKIQNLFRWGSQTTQNPSTTKDFDQQKEIGGPGAGFRDGSGPGSKKPTPEPVGPASGTIFIQSNRKAIDYVMELLEKFAEMFMERYKIRESSEEPNSISNVMVVQKEPRPNFEVSCLFV